MRTMRTTTANLLTALAVVLGVWVSIQVANAAPVSADLSWTAPTERVDGTALDPSEIAEYRVYRAVDSDIDPSSAPATVSTGNAEVVTIDLMPRAEPYMLLFAVTAVDTAGNESDLSNVEIKSVLVRSTANPTAPTALKFEIRCDGECSVTVAE